MIQITNSKAQLFKKSGIWKTTTANTVYSTYPLGYAPYTERYEQAKWNEELNDRIELLKLGERYGGLITFNGNQVLSLVENCDILLLNKSWLEFEYMFTDVLKNKNGYVEVLKAGCDEGRYYGGKRKASS